MLGGGGDEDQGCSLRVFGLGLHLACADGDGATKGEPGTGAQEINKWQRQSFLFVLGSLRRPRGS